MDDIKTNSVSSDKIDVGKFILGQRTLIEVINVESIFQVLFKVKFMWTSLIFWCFVRTTNAGLSSSLIMSMCKYQRGVAYVR